MNCPVLILRPVDGARKTEISALEKGLEPVVDPLFQIRRVSWSARPAHCYDAIMFTSANAIRMAGSKLEQYAGLKALVVGGSTERVSRASGFDVREVGTGGVQSLIDMLPDDDFRQILWLSGKHHSNIQSSRSIDQVAVYDSTNIGLGDLAQKMLRKGVVVLLHSTRAAQQLVDEMTEAAISHHPNHIVAISPKVAEAAGDGWKSMHVASQPTDEALLTAAVRLCSS